QDDRHDVLLRSLLCDAGPRTGDAGTGMSVRPILLQAAFFGAIQGRASPPGSVRPKPSLLVRSAATVPIRLPRVDPGRRFAIARRRLAGSGLAAAVMLPGDLPSLRSVE